jgi:hypothetical protein
MEFLNETTLVAVLKVKAGFFEVPVHLRVEVADISPIESFATLVTASKGAFRSVLRVSFALVAVAEELTCVVCTAVEDTGRPAMRLLRCQQRRFAGQIFRSIKNRLEHSLRR